MLYFYARHYPPYPQTDLDYRRCRCPKWICGRPEKEGLVRKSAHTRNWSRAERLARELERRAEFRGAIAVKAGLMVGAFSPESPVASTNRRKQMLATMAFRAVQLGPDKL